MLSRVAERVYWAARYLERIENTARLILVYDQLIFDLPRHINIGWYSLITINGAEEAFTERYKNQDERNVVKFLLGDDSNSSSVRTCLRWARENLRTTRDVVPADSWELINEMNLFFESSFSQGVNRSQRFQFLEELIKNCQQITGHIHGTMPRDDAWCFMQLGRTIERADMTTRIMDAGVRAELVIGDEPQLVNTRQVVWGHVLRSLGADQSYRRAMRASVSSALVAEYILEDSRFPRSIDFCLSRLSSAAKLLPRNIPVNKLINNLMAKVFRDVDYSDLGEPMKERLNDLQLDLASVHNAIAENWFRL